MKKEMLIAVLSIFLSLSLFGCEQCGEEVKSEVISPENMFVATLFERNCGATTDFVAHINIRRISDKVKADSAGTIKQGEIFIAKGRPRINLIWKDEKNLVIECLKCHPDDIFKEDVSWEDINISYQKEN